MKKISREKTRHKKWNALLPYLLAGTALAVLLVGFIAARYILKWDGSQIAASGDFYFTSDMLEETKAEYNIDPGADRFEIHLYNYADAERISSKEITYTVTADNGTVGSAGGNLAGGSESTAAITITPNSGAADITVTATATKPYKKTIQAVFHRSEGSYYTVEDKTGNRAAVLTMTCTHLNDTKEITITLPSGIVPDATDSRIKKNGTAYIFMPQEKGIYSLVLFKSDTTKTLTKGKTAFEDAITVN